MGEYFIMNRTTVAFAFFASACTWVSTAEDAFYTAPALFSTRPAAVSKYSQSVDRLGPVGIGIELTQPAFGMKVKNVEAGSPAAATGKIKAGQIIETINGQKLKDIDPRIQLGSIVTKAEEMDGMVTLVVKDTKDAKPESVTVNIPVLGAYSKTWPLNCSKSDKIVRNLATLFKKQGHSGNVGLDGPKMLFLLSTGEAEDLEVVRGWVKTVVENNRDLKGIYQWNIAWGAPPLAEYYLRTGDESVLPLMKQICDSAKRAQWDDGWSGRGQGGHHMGLAGTGTLEFILLAKQCGVEVDDVMLQRALQHYYRFAGRGTNPYMDYPPETTFTDNGRNARLAFAMAAASRLRPEGEDSLYAKARDVCAMKSFYSTSYMLHGHTGGGIGEIWRSAAMGMMADKKPNHYREFMDQRTWFYDLSRRYNGSFGIVGGSDRYDNEEFGVGMGLTYTAPRRKLCIFGAPRSKFAKTDNAIPYRCWGSEADDAFLSMVPPRMPDGKERKLDDEKVATDTGLSVDRKMSDPNVSDSEILQFIYHPEHRFREVAAQAIAKYKRYHLIPDLLKSSDPRVRNAGIIACDSSLLVEGDAIPGVPRDDLRALVFKIFNDPKDAWFTQYKVLGLLKSLNADTLRPHTARLLEFLNNDEWWLNESSLTALVPLMADSKACQIVLPAIEKRMPDLTRWSWAFSKGIAALNPAETKTQKMIAESLGRIYLAYPSEKARHAPGGVDPAFESVYLNALAYTISGMPGGFEVLYEVSRKRNPQQALSHSDLFLSRADIAKQDSPLQAAITKTIKDELIPKHVAANWDVLQSFARAKTEHSGSMDALLQLYDRADVKQYNWQDYGPDRSKMSWFYYSFDPKEEWFGVSDRLGRYRDITFPAGMETWFAKDFDAKAHGWKQGLAPFGSADGQKGYIGEINGICPISHCRCGEPINTLWEKDVILLHGTFKMPEFEDGYCYRLVYGGVSHVGSGGGYKLYVNGKPFEEDKSGVDRRAGNPVIGRVITKEFWPEFSGREVTLAAISFMKHHPRTGKMGGNITFFLQRMKVPPLSLDMMGKVATLKPMSSSSWQHLQDPEVTPDDPDEGKFRWDGKFNANTEILGSWQQLGEVATVQDFKANQRLRAATVLPNKLTFTKDGRVADEPLYYTGDMLLHLPKNEALKMYVKEIEGTSYLFVEAGGFSSNHKAGWKCPLVVYKHVKQNVLKAGAGG
jgi:hypothetical protein